MRLSLTAALIAAGALALPACHKQTQPSEQNIAMTNEIPANADIEMLPPDESSETPSNQLANGMDNPDVNDVTTNGD